MLQLMLITKLVDFGSTRHFPGFMMKIFPLLFFHFLFLRIFQVIVGTQDEKHMNNHGLKREVGRKLKQNGKRLITWQFNILISLALCASEIVSA